jgi:hypothetical protein
LPGFNADNTELSALRFICNIPLDRYAIRPDARPVRGRRRVQRFWSIACRPPPYPAARCRPGRRGPGTHLARLCVWLQWMPVDVITAHYLEDDGGDFPTLASPKQFQG